MELGAVGWDGMVGGMIPCRDRRVKFEDWRGGGKGGGLFGVEADFALPKFGNYIHGYTVYRETDSYRNESLANG